MPRALWKGAISFGLVHIPVALYPAARENRIDFDWLDKKTMKPVGYKRVNKATGREVSKDDIVKGVEVSDGHYVVLGDDEIRSALPQTTQTVESDSSFTYESGTETGRGKSFKSDTKFRNLACGPDQHRGHADQIGRGEAAAGGEAGRHGGWFSRGRQAALACPRQGPAFRRRKEPRRWPRSPQPSGSHLRPTPRRHGAGRRSRRHSTA